jgi:hypothetical protein
MADQAMRARVVRLLQGDRRVDDITRLFLFARDRCDGRESVQEIGDFVAHHDERVKGIVTRTVRDWVAIVRMFSIFSNKILDPGRLPPFLPNYLWASARRMKQKDLSNKLGMVRADVLKKLPDFVRGPTQNNDGTYSINNCMNKHATDIS